MRRKKMPLDQTIPCLGFLGFFTIIFGSLVLIRWFRHREIIAMVDKGLLPEQYAQPPSEGWGRFSLVIEDDITQPPRAGRGRRLVGWGIALAALGLALMIGLWPIGFVADRSYPLYFGPWMLSGLIPLFIGLGLLITYYLTRQEEPPTPEAESREGAKFPGD
jgi:hypothetical protein